MRRIQFYPSQELEQRLAEEASNLGVSVSTLVVDLLSEHYRMVAKNMYSESQITKMVFDELKSFVSDPNNAGKEFDLLSASETFRSIEMTFEGKPSTIRAKIGKEFSKQVDLGDAFSKVLRSYKANGKLKKSVNNATIYRIIE
jgi:hypothetical protein